MKNITTNLSLILVVLLAGSCSRQFTTASYEEAGYKHRTLAILPYEMIFTGNLPRDLTPEMVEEIEEFESLAFQVSMYHMLHSPSNLNRRPMRITIQHYEETNRRLHDEGIDIRESWFVSAEALAKILEVDAVVKTRVEKTRFMSDMASYGIAVTQDIVRDFSGYIPFPSSRSGQVFLSCSILDGEEGFPVWVFSDVEQAYWNRPAEQVIDGINRRAANNFPYRERYD